MAAATIADLTSHFVLMSYIPTAEGATPLIQQDKMHGIHEMT